MSRAQGSGLAALLADFRAYAGPRLWLSLLVMLAGSVAEGFGLLMIVPLASIATGREVPIFSRFAVSVGSISPGQRFALALAIFVAAMAARSVLLFARDLQLARLQTAYEASLRTRSAAILAARGWPFASRIGQAGMQSLLLNDVPRAAHAVGFAQNAVVDAVMLAVQLTLTAILSPVLTAVAVVVLAMGGLLSRRWLRRGVRSGMAISETAEESASSGFRLHAGLKAALAQGTVPAFLDEYRSSLARASAQILQFARDYSSAQQLASFAAAATAALLLFIGVRLLSLPFPVLIAALVLFARMSGPARGLQQSLQQMAAFAPSFAVIEQRLGKLEPVPEQEQRRDPLEWDDLTIEGARFEHQPGLGLKGANLALHSGEWVGVGGPSGSGKTTLVDLIAGLLSPERGQINVDGLPLTGDTLERWRAGLAYVGQEGTVFNDSIRGNLLAEGSRAAEAEQWQALELVGLANRVRALPGRLDESVGDRGSQLSGGERQRLALARALLRRPRLLLLDEATSALDAESEAALLDALRSIAPRPAAIVVAHRESTLAYCDSVLSIQHGDLSKSGE
jgi:ABC-type bacteriocin/lantibiotic exporter with double-glycine peptidase domain